MAYLKGALWEGESSAHSATTTNFGGANNGSKVIGFIKLQIPAGKATPAPPVGPALGQHGVTLWRSQRNLTNAQRTTQVL